MDYFMMHQDSRVQNAAMPTGSNAGELRAMTCDEIKDISATVILYVDKSGTVEYPDYLDSPIILVSEKLKRIMCKYQKDAVFKTVILIEKEANHQEIYYLAVVPQLDCVSAETVYDTQGSIKELVLNREKIGHARIFCLNGHGNRLLVRLDVAESILRREPDGVWFEKVRAV